MLKDHEMAELKTCIQRIKLELSVDYKTERRAEALEKAVEKHTAQRYERSIAERVSTEVKRLGEAEVKRLEGTARAAAESSAGASYKNRFVSRLEVVVEHLHDQNFGIAQDDLQELLEELRGY